jgi:hypothetical protein
MKKIGTNHQHQGKLQDQTTNNQIKIIKESNSTL